MEVEADGPWIVEREKGVKKRVVGLKRLLRFQLRAG
jgi:hypothetical protein